MSTAFLFPGQGSQFSGMGADLFPQYPELVSASDEILGYSIVELCESEDSFRLNSTNFTQPALYVVSCLQAKALLDDGKNPSFCRDIQLVNLPLFNPQIQFLSRMDSKWLLSEGEIMAKVSGGGIWRL